MVQDRQSVHAPPGSLETAAARVLARCRTLAACTEVPGETTRTFLSEPMHAVHRLTREWMHAAGMVVRVDAIGNLRGLAGTPTAPRLVIASHLDTVPQAGAFDGILGVLLGIALAEQSPALPFAVEVIGFSEEEGVRFRKPFLGSMAASGTLHPATLALTDPAGTTVSEAIRHFGLDPAHLADARFAPTTFAYLEFHIEQGPVLESLGRPLGVVTSLVGQSRLEFVFAGQANHAGTTPMHLRHDALTAAAEWIVAVEAHARACPDLVATVGSIAAHPGAGNVVPGRVTATLDLRHAADSAREAALAHLIGQADTAGKSRGVHVAHTVTLHQPAVPLDPALRAHLEAAARDVGHHAHPMTSGAGHDAMIVAPHYPAAMLFLRSPGGLSHHPDEAVLPEDVVAALATGLAFLHRLAATHPLETA